MKDFSIIVAMDDSRGIGKTGLLPWSISGDMKHFKAITLDASDGKQNAVIMGRKTWESIPERFRPLPERLNVVLSKNNNLSLPQYCLKFSNLNEALEAVSIRNDVDQLFVIGGEMIFNQAISFSECKKLYITEISGDFGCDVFFPAIPPSFKKISQSPVFQENNYSFSFTEYQKI